MSEPGDTVGDWPKGQRKPCEKSNAPGEDGHSAGGEWGTGFVGSFHFSQSPGAALLPRCQFALGAEAFVVRDGFIQNWPGSRMDLLSDGGLKALR